MIMRVLFTTLTIILALYAPALAVPSVDYSLFAPDPINHPGRVEVGVTFDSDGDLDAVLTLVQLSIVEGPPGVLTSGGADYGKFTFTDSASIQNWDAIIRTEINDVPGTISRSLFSPDVALFGLINGTHTLGVLDIDLSSLTPGSAISLSIGLLGDLSGTSAAFQADPNDDQTFDIVPIVTGTNATITITVPQQQQVVVPEPASATLSALALLAISASRRGRRER